MNLSIEFPKQHNFNQPLKCSQVSKEQNINQAGTLNNQKVFQTCIVSQAEINVFLFFSSSAI